MALGAVTQLQQQTGKVPSDRPGGGSVALFLSLYLLLLAFFILLVAISSYDTSRSRQVIQGLTSQFSGDSLLQTPRIFSSVIGNYLEPAEFLGRVTSIYESAIPTARVRVVSLGRDMQWQFHIDTLFEHDTEKLRPAQRRAIAEIVAALILPPPGIRYLAEVVLSVPKGALPAVRERAVRRAGVLGRAFVEQGAPSGVVTVALEDGDVTQARMVFRVVEATTPAREVQP